MTDIFLTKDKEAEAACELGLNSLYNQGILITKSKF